MLLKYSMFLINFLVYIIFAGITSLPDIPPNILKANYGEYMHAFLYLLVHALFVAFIKKNTLTISHLRKCAIVFRLYFALFSEVSTNSCCSNRRGQYLLEFSDGMALLSLLSRPWHRLG